MDSEENLKGQKNFKNHPLPKLLQFSFFIIFTGLFSFSLGVFVGKNWSDRQLKKPLPSFDPGNREGGSVRALSELEADTSFDPGNRESGSGMENRLKQKTSSHALFGLPVENSIQRPDSSPKILRGGNKKKKSGELDSLGFQGLFSSLETTSSSWGLGFQNSGQSVQSVLVPKQDPLAVEDEQDLGSPGKIKKRKPKEKGFYTIQVSAYKTEKEAQTHVRSLREKGFPAFFLEKKVKGKIWFRVNIGSFKKKKRARKYEKALKRQTWIKESMIRRVLNLDEKSY